MAKRNSSGTCNYCKAVLPLKKMIAHLAECPNHLEHLQQVGKGKPKEPQKIFQLQVTGYFDPQYWWLIEVPADMSLQSLDQWLRDVWVECCGHMSQFNINDTMYISNNARELGGMTMKQSLGELLNVGSNFGYEYDFGDTTVIDLLILSERMGSPGKNKIEPMARNVAPTYKCECGDAAVFICSYCGEGKPVFLCEACAEDHDCDAGQDGLLPVVNSPRMGVCGYTGQ